jgi:hypothetical protein
MARRHITLAFATLLASAPLVGAAAAAQPGGAPDRASAPAASTRVDRTSKGDTATPVPNVESIGPAAPVPMNLPDDANAHEVDHQYGVGMAGLIIGTVLTAAIVVGVVFFIARRSWSTSH